MMIKMGIILSSIVTMFFCIKMGSSQYLLHTMLENLNSKFSMEQNLLLSVHNNYIYFAATVILISSMIFIYSKMYFMSPMENNKDYMFTYNLFFFMSSMVILIMSSSMIVIMLGWDGLGVSSFLLITYYSNLSSQSSALVTFNLNRLGDLFMMVVIVLMVSMNSPSFFFVKLWYYKKLLVVFFILGCMTKSAQMPFSAWLPAAMAAPTPVSSLVHSSTLVTAGIFLIIKLNTLVKLEEISMFMLMSIALVLSAVSGLFATMENDIKKMVAMSTLSQLGILMFTALSVEPFLALFHTISHAFFKSLLFMLAGMMIIFSSNTQDQRKMSTVKNSNFLLITAALITLLNLVGFPILSGFSSKDSIILSQYPMGMVLFNKIILIVSCIISVVYCSKFMMYFSNTSFKLSSSLDMIRPNFSIQPILLLSMMSVMTGKIFMYLLMEKEYYKMYYLEKITGMLIILIGGCLFLIPKSIGNKNYEWTSEAMKNMFQNMVYMKFISVEMFHSFFNKIANVSMLENTMWKLISTMSTSSAYLLKVTITEKQVAFTSVALTMMMLMMSS